jgi:6-phosphogluconate dehydrogenase
MSKREFGIVGLGRMGGGLALHALARGFRVAGFARKGAGDDLKIAGLVECARLEDLATALSPPRIIFLYVPAGKIVDHLIASLPLSPGDIVADGGNSYWGDSQRRHRELLEQGVHFVDVGTSGGVDGALFGACFMAGGDSKSIGRIRPILEELAEPGGCAHAGGPGAGHFAKLVHNGIEFGMLQAIGEGFDLLSRFPDPVRINEVLSCWRHGSVIRSWLIDLLEQAVRREGGAAAIPPYVEDTGEVNWLVGDALRFEASVPVIAQSVMQLIATRDRDGRAARAVAMMRHGFGGHPYGPDEGIAEERREGKVGEAPRLRQKRGKLGKVRNHRGAIQGRRRSRPAP